MADSRQNVYPCSIHAVGFIILACIPDMIKLLTVGITGSLFELSSSKIAVCRRSPELSAFFLFEMTKRVVLRRFN